MKFIDIIKKHSWDDIRNRLFDLYPDQINSLKGYESMYESLLTLPEEKIEDNMRLCITHIHDYLTEEDQEEYEHVCGKNGKFLTHNDDKLFLDKDNNPIEETYALEFNSWSYWLSLPIDELTLQNYEEIDIICHCIWEMTFFGFDYETVEKQSKGILDEIEDRKKYSKDEDYISFDEFKQSIKKETT